MTDHIDKPLSEAALLGICLSHKDGTATRDKALYLKRSRKLGARKNMTDFFGDVQPPPMSPTSPTYFGVPRLGISQAADPKLRDGSTMGKNDSLAPAARKKINRASIISVMSGLGADLPPSPSSGVPGSAKSRTDSSFLPLPSGKQRLYNFFGHRPPSELISNHLADYFPSTKKKELEKTVRQSMMRISTSGPPSTRRGSVAPSIVSERFGGDGASIKYGISPKRRSTVKSTVSSPPGSVHSKVVPIPEEGDDEGVPRMSVSDVSGKTRRPQIDGSPPSVPPKTNSGPPLLPPFEPSETLTDSLQAYSPSPAAESQGFDLAPRYPAPPRPKSIMRERRNSASSSKSRMSMLSQLRKARDRSDNASLLTVDEITAEVENRRASTISFDETDEEQLQDEYYAGKNGDSEDSSRVQSDVEGDVEATVGVAVADKAGSALGQSVPAEVTGDEGDDEDSESEDESSEEDSDESDSDDTDSDSDEDDDDDEEEAGEKGQKFTSAGCKLPIISACKYWQ